MKNQFFNLLVLLFPCFLFSQNVEVIGGVITDSINVNSGLIKNVANPKAAQDAATKAYVDFLEAKVDSLESRVVLVTANPVATDDSLAFFNVIMPYSIDVLDSGTPDFDPDAVFRYGSFIKITSIGSFPGSNNKVSKKGRPLMLNNNGTGSDHTDDIITYTPIAFEKDTFYYVITDLDGLKDTAQVKVLVSRYIQDRLDIGESPLEIYNCIHNLDSLYGKSYVGGLIAYLNTSTGSGLISSHFDQSTGTEWGCLPKLTTANFNGIGFGQSNTTTIVDSCSVSGIAARLCDDLITVEGGITYNDWFLPSKDELNALYHNLKARGFGSFTNSYYWSSSEHDSMSAAFQYFYDGNQYNGNKAGIESVRAVRSF